MAWIFVGGSQRSGTSLLQQLLCQPPLTNPYVYECAYLHRLVAAYEDVRNNFSRNHQCYFNGEEGFRTFHSLLVRAFLEHSIRHLNAESHLVLKEPHLTALWPYLYELVPDAIFLMIVRDPRDTIASMVTVGEKQKRLGQSYFFADRDIPAMCRHMMSFCLPALSVTDPDFRRRLAVVLYEELVQQPEKVLGQISGFTGIDFVSGATTNEPRSGIVDEDWNRRSKLYFPWVTEVSGKAVSESRVGSWKSVLTDEEVLLVEENCQSFFEWFGYERSAQPVSMQPADAAADDNLACHPPEAAMKPHFGVASTEPHWTNSTHSG